MFNFDMNLLMILNKEMQRLKKKSRRNIVLNIKHVKILLSINTNFNSYYLAIKCFAWRRFMLKIPIK